MSRFMRIFSCIIVVFGIALSASVVLAKKSSEKRGNCGTDLKYAVERGLEPGPSKGACAKKALEQAKNDRSMMHKQLHHYDKSRQAEILKFLRVKAHEEKVDRAEEHHLEGLMEKHILERTHDKENSADHHFTHESCAANLEHALEGALKGHRECARGALTRIQTQKISPLKREFEDHKDRKVRRAISSFLMAVAKGKTPAPADLLAVQKIVPEDEGIVMGAPVKAKKVETVAHAKDSLAALRHQSCTASLQAAVAHMLEAGKRGKPTPAAIKCAEDVKHLQKYTPKKSKDREGWAFVQAYNKAANETVTVKKWDFKTKELVSHKTTLKNLWKDFVKDAQEGKIIQHQRGLNMMHAVGIQAGATGAKIAKTHPVADAVAHEKDSLAALRQQSCTASLQAAVAHILEAGKGGKPTPAAIKCAEDVKHLQKHTPKKSKDREGWAFVQAYNKAADETVVVEKSAGKYADGTARPLIAHKTTLKNLWKDFVKDAQEGKIIQHQRGLNMMHAVGIQAGTTGAKIAKTQHVADAEKARPASLLDGIKAHKFKHHVTDAEKVSPHKFSHLGDVTPEMLADHQLQPVSKKDQFSPEAEQLIDDMKGHQCLDSVYAAMVKSVAHHDAECAKKALHVIQNQPKRGKSGHALVEEYTHLSLQERREITGALGVVSKASHELTKPKQNNILEPLAHRYFEKKK